MDGTANNLHVVLKQISKFDGNKADDFLEWSSKLRASLSIYNRAILKHNARARAAVGDRQSGHRPCGVGCRQPGSIQHTVLFDGRLSLLRRTEIRGHDT